MKLLDAIRIYRETIGNRPADFQREIKDENGNSCYRDLLIYPTHPDAIANFKRDYILHHAKKPDYITMVDGYKFLDLGVGYFIYNTSHPDTVEVEKDLGKF